jgi:hypothetical protein
MLHLAIALASEILPMTVSDSKRHITAGCDIFCVIWMPINRLGLSSGQAPAESLELLRSISSWPHRSLP